MVALHRLQSTCCSPSPCSTQSAARKALLSLCTGQRPSPRVMLLRFSCIVALLQASLPAALHALAMLCAQTSLSLSLADGQCCETGPRLCALSLLHMASYTLNCPMLLPFACGSHLLKLVAKIVAAPLISLPLLSEPFDFSTRWPYKVLTPRSCSLSLQGTYGPPLPRSLQNTGQRPAFLCPTTPGQPMDPWAASSSCKAQGSGPPFFASCSMLAQ